MIEFDPTSQRPNFPGKEAAHWWGMGWGHEEMKCVWHQPQNQCESSHVHERFELSGHTVFSGKCDGLAVGEDRSAVHLAVNNKPANRFPIRDFLTEIPKPDGPVSRAR